ncbi:ISL3 family transposase [Brevibacillus nitrificans]|uniref:ISL3 family transposase n=1 Tax=Brevibacillus nitrificans TaxID=651560 RepID=UPI0028568BC8|nr:ISL3 family transposase [Brevibacillus nitrificans]MDR7318936.1 transposase [Brevibacillus nitrificans]
MDILNLSAYNVLETEYGEHDIHIKVETKAPPFVCPHCGCVANLYKHSKRDQLVMDLPIHGKRVGLIVKRQRYKCRECNQTFWERLPVVDEKRYCTRRLVQYIERKCLKHTFTSVAEEVGMDEKTIRNIFRDYINELEAELRFETPRWLGIDEIHIIKKPRCVLSNVEEHTLLDLLQDRNKTTVVGYLSRLPNKSNVKYVAMDMWQPYRDAVKATLPNAVIVVDKFHVVRMANQAMETIRKNLRSGLTPKQRRGLMHDRFILLKRKKELDGKGFLTLDLWTKNYPDLGVAYNLKESFFDIWDCETKDEAIQMYRQWEASIPDSMRAAFEPLTRAMGNWSEEIFNYFDHRITNAYTESLNSLIRVMNRLGRGYSFEALRAKILFTEGLKKVRPPKFAKNIDEEKFGMAMIAPISGGEVLGINISTLIEMLEDGDL